MGQTIHAKAFLSSNVGVTLVSFKIKDNTIPILSIFVQYQNECY